VLVPSIFARERLRALGAPLPWERVRVLAPPLRLPIAAEPAAGSGAPYALVVSRLAPEKGVEVAIDACRLAGIALLIAGEGPEREALQARAAGAEVSFLGRVPDEELAELRAGAAIALAPSRELVAERGLVAPGDPRALARAIAELAGDRAEGRRSIERVRALCAPEVVAEGLGEIYGPPGGTARRPAPRP
jgi:hypothetical protein